MQRKIFLLSIFILLTTIINAQTKDYSPEVSGLLKTFHLTNLTTGQGEFSVVHTRIGIRGNMSENISYKVFTEFNGLLGTSVTGTDSDGDGELNSVKLNLRSILLDAIMNIKLTDRLNFSVGQYKVPFSTSNLKSPVHMEFVNRPLTTSVTPALRDVGLTVYYANKDVLPVEAAVGAFNGAGENTKENNKTTNYVSRLVVKPISALSISANYYGGKLGTADVNIFGFGAHAKFSNILLDGEYVSRKSELASASNTSTGYFAYAGYVIKTEFWLINSITPLVRYESFDPSTDFSSDELNRVTAGINFGLSDKNVTGIRVNYESRTSSNIAFSADDYLYFSFQVVF